LQPRGNYDQLKKSRQTQRTQEMNMKNPEKSLEIQMNTKKLRPDPRNPDEFIKIKTSPNKLRSISDNLQQSEKIKVKLKTQEMSMKKSITILRNPDQ